MCLLPQDKVESGGRPQATPITRIYITASGDMIVTDLWDEVAQLIEVAAGGKL